MKIFSLILAVCLISCGACDSSNAQESDSTIDPILSDYIDIGIQKNQPLPYTAETINCKELIDKSEDLLKRLQFREAASAAVDAWKCLSQVESPHPGIINRVLQIADTAYVQINEHRRRFELHRLEILRNAQSTKPDSQLMIVSLISMGWSKLAVSESMDAIPLFLRADTILSGIEYSATWNKEMLYCGLALSYRYVGIYPKYDTVESRYWRKLVQVWENEGTRDRENQAMCLKSIAECFEQLNMDDSTLVYYARSHVVYVDTYGEFHEKSIATIKEMIKWLDDDMTYEDKQLQAWPFYLYYLKLLHLQDTTRELLQIVDSFAIEHSNYFSDSAGLKLAILRLRIADSLSVRISDTTRARFYSDLGQAYLTKRDYTQSLKAYDTALAYSRILLGENHRALGLIHHKKAIVYKVAGDTDSFNKEYLEGMRLLTQWK